MPKTNGVMLSKGIKAKNPDQAIIISSAYTDEKYLVELINIGVDGFLKKPVNIDNLFNTIIKTLNLVQQRNEYLRIKFKTLTREITKKDIAITKSPYQKAIEESEINSAKTSIKEFMEKLKQDDPESYTFLISQKEFLFDILHELVDTYELFAYRQYTQEELLEDIIKNLLRLYSTLEFFDRVKKTATQVLRLSNILKDIKLNHLTLAQLESFDILEFLLNDIKQYILDMFIEENVQDINYFHESLKDNITSFENILNETDDDDDDEIEFL